MPHGRSPSNDALIDRIPYRSSVSSALAETGIGPLRAVVIIDLYVDFPGRYIVAYSVFGDLNFKQVLGRGPELLAVSLKVPSARRQFHLIQLHAADYPNS